MNKRYFIILALLLAAVPFFIDVGLGMAEKTILSIVIFIAALWLTETFPLWITAIFVPVLLVLFTNTTAQEAFSPFFDPIIALLFGGFVLARALHKHKLDIIIVNFFIEIFGDEPKRFLLGIMAATAFMSFWISNTASALLMIPIGIAALNATGLKPLKSTYSKALMIGIGYAATIGGTATLIGTPPNLIAVKFLAESGIQMSFLHWMFYALPIVVVMILVAWLVLIKMYKPEIKKVHAPHIKHRKLNNNQKFVLAIFALTALLWLTQTVHGIHNSVVAMLPVLSLFGFNVLQKEDLGKIRWNILLLVGGSLSLGLAIQSSGLSVEIANVLGSILVNQPHFLVYLIIGMIAILFTAIGTNTGSAAILVPIVIPLAPILGVNPMILAILIGMVVSYDLIVPVGTPPNTISYGTGYIKMWDMIKPGLIISTISVFLFAAMAIVWGL